MGIEAIDAITEESVQYNVFLIPYDIKVPSWLSTDGKK